MTTNNNPQEKRIPVTLIAGCGDIGGRLAVRLLTDGHRVYGLRRHTSRLPDNVHPIQGDMAEGCLGEWPEYIDYVIYSAAAGRQGESGYRKTYVDGLTHVINHLKSLSEQPKRLFFTSSTAVYHQKAGEWVDELSSTHPETFNGKIMLEAERLLIDSELPATVVRFGGIYGPGRNYMLKKVQSGEVYVQEPVTYGNRIHAEDCAGILQWLIQKDFDNQCVHPLYLGVDSAPAPLGEVTEWLAQRMNVQPMSEVSPNRGSKRCRNQRILDAGYCFRFPDYREGYDSLLKNS